MAQILPPVGRKIAVRVTYVSSVKSYMYGVNVFTYTTEDISNKDSFTDVPEFDLSIAEWVK